jgi:hypothetical protein
LLTSDYEGATDDFGAGRESGYATLDAIRAAEHQLDLSADSTPVGAVGYSGGSIATEWASELQPVYAPERDMIGVAEGGIPADFAHNLSYLDGSSTWAGGDSRHCPRPLARVAPGSLEALQRRRRTDPQVGRAGLSEPERLPRPDIRGPAPSAIQRRTQVKTFVDIVNDSITARAGTPGQPLLMAVGNSVGTGEGVMVTKDVQELAHTYCGRGVPVQLSVYSYLNHFLAAIQFEVQALRFFHERYNGKDTPNQCTSIGPGNALTPLPEP